MSFQGILDFFIVNWWLIFIPIGIIGVWAYSKLDTYVKIQLKKIFSPKVLLIIGAVVCWFLWNKFGQSAMVSNANRYMPIFILLILLAMNYIEKLRYHSQQMLTPNMHGSFSKAPLLYNGFYIFALDSFNAGGLSWDYAKRILILREETCQFFERGAVSIARPTKVSIYAIDEDLKSIIENDAFLKGAGAEIYYGWFDDMNQVDFDFTQLKNLQDLKNEPNHIYNLLKKELGVDNPKVSTLYWLYKNNNKATSKQTEVLDSAIESVEKGVEHHQRVKDAYVDKKEQMPKVEPHEEY